MRKTFEQKSQTAFYNEIYKAKLSAKSSIVYKHNDPRQKAIDKMFDDIENFITELVKEEQQLVA